jgi:hypothetical protein
VSWGAHTRDGRSGPRGGGKPPVQTQTRACHTYGLVSVRLGGAAARGEGFGDAAQPAAVLENKRAAALHLSAHQRRTIITPVIVQRCF